jgi:putative Mn2+ efflux pump MntP
VCSSDAGELVMLAVATSIDSLALGITFSFIDTAVMRACTVIGVIAFVLSAAGVYIGNRFGAGSGKKAGVAGGIILIAIGLKVFLEHMGIV